MTPLLSFFILVAGFLLLIKGADWLVEGASSIAKIFGMSDLMIGLTIVAFGTSMPELLVNVIASVQGNTDIVIGDVLGSNIANTLLVLGLAAIITPLYVRTNTIWKEIPFGILAAAVVFIAANDSLINGSGSVSIITRSEGMIMIAFFFIFLYYTFSLEREDGKGSRKSEMSVPKAFGYVLLGCILLPIGGKLVVNAALSIARLFHVSEAFIGFSLVALGTSLPEAAAACVAAWRGKVDIAVGNVVGSNIFNIFWVLGISAMIRPLVFDPVFNADLLVVIASSMMLLFFVHKGALYRRVFFFWKKKKEFTIVAHEGIILLMGYAGYLVYIALRG